MKVKDLEKLLPNDTLMIIEKHYCNYSSEPEVIKHNLILHIVGSLKPNPASDEEVFMMDPIDKKGIHILLKSDYI